MDKNSDVINNQIEQNENSQESVVFPDVTQYTANLWKYQEIPEEPEPHTEYEFMSVTAGRSIVTGARVRGKKHKHEGINCDDWFETASVGQWIIIAVSDGAGSKKFSRIGAKISCKTVIEFISSGLANFDEHFQEIKQSLKLPLSDDKFKESCKILASIVQSSAISAFQAVEQAYLVRKEIPQFANGTSEMLSMKDFSSTLLIAVTIPLEIRGTSSENGITEHLVISLQIGDGIIASIDNTSTFENALKILGQPDSGSFAGETDFLTSPQMKQLETLMGRTKIVRSKATDLLVMSDGVSDDYFPAVPNILRLYLDLQLNGIIDVSDDYNKEECDETPIENLPHPVAYPWVNDHSKLISIQYSSLIMKETGINLQLLWENKKLKSSCTLEAFNSPLCEKEDKGQALKIWLDNYVERGSFDDRSLVIVEFDKV